MNVSCERTRVFKSKQYDSFYTSVSRKNDDGSYTNLYVNVRFKNDNKPTFDDYRDIKIIHGFLTIATHENNNALVIQIMDYEML